ncbi:hypothetical protein [Neobacillus bataviensis]|uniref:hypothetical protein n=1 Tax=Neobacillus bataviensis TaxID=220685 RepID=UPI001CBDA6AA|nr:hypothetical protein [Neobacillus bataviensis]
MATLNEIQNDLIDLRPNNTIINLQVGTVIVSTDGNLFDSATEISQSDFEHFIAALKTAGVEFKIEEI